MPPKKKDAEEEVGNAARFGRVRNTLKMGIVGERPAGHGHLRLGTSIEALWSPLWCRLC
jgi:hypothetical protein